MSEREGRRVPHPSPYSGKSVLLVADETSPMLGGCRLGGCINTEAHPHVHQRQMDQLEKADWLCPSPFLRRFNQDLRAKHLAWW